MYIVSRTHSDMFSGGITLIFYLFWWFFDIFWHTGVKISCIFWKKSPKSRKMSTNVSKCQLIPFLASTWAIEKCYIRTSALGTFWNKLKIQWFLALKRYILTIFSKNCKLKYIKIWFWDPKTCRAYQFCENKWLVVLWKAIYYEFILKIHIFQFFWNKSAC